MTRPAVLVWPPVAEPSMPPLGIADLYTFLQRSNRACLVIDANIEFLDLLPILAQSSPPGPIERPQWPRVSDNQVVGSDGEFTNAYLAASRVRARALDSLCRDYQHTLAPSFLRPSAEPGNLSQIRQDATASTGLYQRWLNESSLVQRIRAMDPTWIGIGINYASQLPFAIALAGSIKRESLGPVIFGGALLRDFAGCIGPDTPLWDMVDGIVIGAGEQALASIGCNGNGPFDPPPNGVAIHPGKWLVRDARREITTLPSFDAFPLDSYHAVARTLPVRMSARCSWGRCTYCADAKYDADVKGKEAISGPHVELLANLARLHGARALCFADAEMPTGLLLSVAAALKAQTNGTIYFGCNARFAWPLTIPGTMDSLRYAGCTFLRFGLETGSDRLLGEMRKGISTRLAGAVLKACTAAGIVTHVYLMTGYPGETAADWDKTRAFVFDHLDLIDMCSVSGFELYQGAPIFKHIPHSAIDSKASEENWVYPKLRREPSEAEEITMRIRMFEDDFFAAKGSTRVFHSLADTIFLGGRVRISI